jgi:hypothetical protein
MAFNFQSGHYCPVNWAPSGGVAGTLNIKSHDINLSVLLHDVTGTAAGGVRMRLAGPLDASGNVKADFDLDLPPYAAAPIILPGLSGIITFGISATKGIQIPSICESLHFMSAVENEVTYDWASKMNSKAGFVVYPAL